MRRELRLYNLVLNLTISKPGLKADSSETYPRLHCSFGGGGRALKKQFYMLINI
jgi:hypothetical protein